MAKELDLGEQLALPGLAPAIALGTTASAEHQPVARVFVEKVPLHLDHTFDYLVPGPLADRAVPGARVKVSFGPQLLTGYILARTDKSDHPGRLAPLKDVVSHGSVVAPQTFELCGLVANYYAGTMSDTLRLAVPPRAAKVEKEFFPRPEAEPEDDTEEAYADLGGNVAAAAPPPPLVGNWQLYPAGPAFLNHLSDGGSPRAVWTALPGLGRQENVEDQPRASHWMLALIEAIAATRNGGRGALVILPTSRDVNRLAQALETQGFNEYTLKSGKDPEQATDFVRLTHELGNTVRYRSYLAALTGEVNIVIGTRGAAYAPVKDLGLAVCWDDADESHQDLHAPYSHVREVLALRSEKFNAALLIGSLGRSVHAQGLVHSGWAHELRAERAMVRSWAPRIIAYGEQEMERDGRAAQGRLPSRVWSKITQTLKTGPVLITVPRAGYIPMIACARCRTAAHCAHCHGPLSITGQNADPQCTWCGSLAGGWSCSQCHGTQLRAMRVGSDRTAEELGRAFPNVSVKVSGAKSQQGILDTVDGRPALVIATPGAEPVCAHGYGLGVILDAQVGSAGTSLYADQEAIDRWLHTASLVRGSQDGGEVYLVGQGSAIPTAGLVRWDPIGLAEREFEERLELAMPPAWRVATVTGERLAVNQFLDTLQMPPGGSVLGPVELVNQTQRIGRGRAEEKIPLGAQGTMNAPVRAIVRVPVSQGRELARAIRAMQSIASARRSAALVSVVLDPKELL